MKGFLKRKLFLKKILGTLDAWSMRRLSHQSSNPAYYIGILYIISPLRVDATENLAWFIHQVQKTSWGVNPRLNISFNTIKSVSQFYRKEGWQADRQNPCQMLVNEINSEARDGHPADDDSKPLKERIVDRGTGPKMWLVFLVSGTLYKTVYEASFTSVLFDFALRKRWVIKN